MFEDILKLMCEYIRDDCAELTRHAYDEMNDDDLFVFDLEQCILTGSIVKRQWDDDFQDWKYVIHGLSADGEQIATIAKLAEQQKVVFITTFRL
ncbi:MAG: DUF4258 domain-containing protein [Acidobacteria bacterium]|nr:DUF4258 domain-containing protein [Acidobacteriota bacterium]MBI3426112.1 DUF4258 domain-containing protein [Acidobacteriota bacterium]